jgi:hypothetical protein
MALELLCHCCNPVLDCFPDERLVWLEQISAIDPDNRHLNGPANAHPASTGRDCAFDDSVGEELCLVKRHSRRELLEEDHGVLSELGGRAERCDTGNFMRHVAAFVHREEPGLASDEGGDGGLCARHWPLRLDTPKVIKYWRDPARHLGPNVGADVLH